MSYIWQRIFISVLGAENEIEAHAEGLEGWQLVAGTVAITLATVTLRDLYLRRQGN